MPPASSPPQTPSPLENIIKKEYFIFCATGFVVSLEGLAADQMELDDALGEVPFPRKVASADLQSLQTSSCSDGRACLDSDL
jgi:hypothetical protein